MAEEEKVSADNQGAQTQVQTPAKPSGQPQTRPFATVPANRAADVPAPAAARLTWTDGERTLEYKARAAHLDVRDDNGVLLEIGRASCRERV